MTSKFIFGRTWAWCINILVEVFSYWSIFVIFLKELFSWCIFFLIKGPLKGNVSHLPSSWINNCINSLLSSSYTKYSPLIFESVCISTVYLCDYRRSGAGLYHYSDEIYFRSFCLNRVNRGWRLCCIHVYIFCF